MSNTAKKISPYAPDLPSQGVGCAVEVAVRQTAGSRGTDRSPTTQPPIGNSFYSPPLIPHLPPLNPQPSSYLQILTPISTKPLATPAHVKSSEDRRGHVQSTVGVSMKSSWTVHTKHDPMEEPGETFGH